MTAKLRDAYELVILLGPPLEGAGGALDSAAAEADCSIAALAERPNRRAAKANHEALAWLQAPPWARSWSTARRRRRPLGSGPGRLWPRPRGRVCGRCGSVTVKNPRVAFGHGPRLNAEIRAIQPRPDVPGAGYRS